MKPEEKKIQDETLQKIHEEIQDKIEFNIREARHWFGSWTAVRGLVDKLEENEQEKPYENPKY